MFIPMPGGHQTAPISDDSLRQHLYEAHRRSTARANRAHLSVADAVLADYWDGMRGQHDIKDGQSPAAKALRDQLLWAAGHRPLADAVWRAPVADAASSLPEAGTYVSGPPIAPLYRPTRLLDGLPVRAVPVWTDVVRLDFLQHQGKVAWGRGDDNVMPRSDYTLTSDWTTTPEVVWTSTDLGWRQQQMAQSPLYGVDPAAQKAAAARTAMDQALETACVTTPAGTNILALSNTPALRARSSLTYGTSAIEASISDLTKWVQTISELSLGEFAPNVVAITQRVLNSLYRPVVTSTGYPIDPVALVQSRLAAYGITRVIIAPSLQDYGGTNIDACVAFFDGQYGLKRTVAMPFTPIRTEQMRLSTVTYYAAIVAATYAEHRATTFVYEVGVTPVTLA